MSHGNANGALYNPYINIKDVNWLRANLLMFPYVERMIPMDFLPEDNEAVKKFSLTHKNRDPLLRLQTFGHQDLKGTKNFSI